MQPLPILPPRVGTLIKIYALQHPEYAEEEGARDECGYASDDFLQYLEKKRVKLSNTGLLAVGRTKTYHKYCSGPRGHYVIRLGRVRVDFTARQFHRSFAFPRIWVAGPKEEDWLIKIESHYAHFPCWMPT